MDFFSLVVLCSLILRTFGRPSSVLEGYKEAKEDSYGDRDGTDFDGYTHTGQKASLKRFSGNEQGKADLQDENASSDENSDDEDRARPDKDYLENNDDVDENHGESSHLYHNNMLSAGNDDKRTPEYNKGSNRLYDNNESLHKIQDPSEINEEETVGQNAQAQYFKQYNVMQNVDRGPEMSDVKRYNNERDIMIRNRRQAKNSESDETDGSEEISTQINELGTNEDEETAIKRHIKKLSKEELDELLNSLSEDKRALLKNIIANSPKEYDSINKREITKKAGANDENSFVGSEQSDVVKIQKGSANLESESSVTPDIENSENTQNVLNGAICSKTTEIVSTSEKSIDKVGVLDGIENAKLETANNKGNLDVLQKEEKIQGNLDGDLGTAKNQKKREMNSKSFVDSEEKFQESKILTPLNNEDLYCSENEDYSQLWNEESSLYNNNINKREVSSSNQNSIKSLEDSFPNGDDANNFKPGSDMVPLIRVKRKDFDKVVQKRDGNFLSNLKVPFFSNAVENIEDDIDEGSEFQDDAFFDKRANFAKTGELNRHATDGPTYDEENNSKNCDHNSRIMESDNTDLESDTLSLGSDTDAVLSGIEGVDDNVMYNGVSRNKRTAEELNNSVNNESDSEKCTQGNKVALENENNEVFARQLSPRYQENDAFGSLPRNYEEDLGRFKRIRRLKPLLTSENNDSTLKQ